MIAIHRFSSYFTEPTGQKYLFYLLCLFYVVGTSLVIIIEPFLTLPCDDDHKSELEFENVLYKFSKCDNIRYPILLYLTHTECVRGRHLLVAVFFGSLIGYERRTSDRPAGIRTMALVSLGSALFTINSTFGFLSGPMVSAEETTDKSCVTCLLLDCGGWRGMILNTFICLDLFWY